MKTTLTSKASPLRRALCALLLLALAALWVMPRNARAPLYVSQDAPNSVRAYNAATGAAINANFITGLGGGPSNPLAVEPDWPDRLLPSTLPVLNAAEGQGFAPMPRRVIGPNCPRPNPIV